MKHVRADFMGSEQQSVSSDKEFQIDLPAYHKRFMATRSFAKILYYA